MSESPGEEAVARRERQALVERRIRLPAGHDAAAHPVPHTVLDEEWAHHDDAVRDLTALESRS